jgi:hypothetical protein
VILNGTLTLPDGQVVGFDITPGDILADAEAGFGLLDRTEKLFDAIQQALIDHSNEVLA